ncbi:MAG: MaoC family dehydratase [Beijerinckiaceae bacterium]|nr:MaoC family dehydratase [Beijerinckiaceae bacterium]
MNATSTGGADAHNLPAIGTVLSSDWVLVTQDMIDSFSKATLDADPMHVNAEFASKGPFGGTIAFGFLTMSLMTHMMNNATGHKGTVSFDDGYYLNYGFDRLRLVSPVPVNSRVRGIFTLKDRKPGEHGRIVQRFDTVIEIENQERPAAVAEWLSIFMPPGKL